MTHRIIVEYGKHGDTFWDATTNEDLDWAALQILRQKLEWGWPDPRVEEESEYMRQHREDAGLTNEQIAALPTNRMRADAEDRRKYAKRYVKAADEEAHEYQLALKLSKKDSSLVRTARGTIQSEAWNIVNKRSDYEYERVELETLQSRPEPA